MPNPYKARFDSKLQELGINIIQDLRQLDCAASDVQNQVLAYLAELAFAAQNVSNISLGRLGLSLLPSSWLHQRLDQLLEPHLARNDEWEYRRIAEFLSDFDVRALEMHLQVCSKHHDKNIREIASEFGNNLSSDNP